MSDITSAESDVSQSEAAIDATLRVRSSSGACITRASLPESLRPTSSRRRALVLISMTPPRKLPKPSQPSSLDRRLESTSALTSMCAGAVNGRLCDSSAC
jgi:hypothetical protein